MREQERDHLLAGRVVGGVEAELLEPLVLAHEVARWPREESQEPGERRPIGWGGEILDDVARDAALAQDVQRAARLASAGVVIDGHALHGACTSRGAEHAQSVLLERPSTVLSASRGDR